MRNTRLFLIATLLFATIQLSAETVFKTGNLESARIQAEMEGKMLIIDFYASWCAPCKWMEETTFADADIRQILTEKFVPLKIDIDDFDGYALKQEYGVNVLPTLLIFNEDGKIIERVEETLPPSKMKKLLEKSLASFTPKVHATNMSPSKVMELSKKAERKERFEEVTQAATYKLQLALFNSYDETLNYHSQLTGLLEEPIIIMHDYKAGQVVYRVLIGNFGSTSEAHYYQSDLKSKFNIDSHIYM